jgi:hypothetical protein
VGRWRRPAFFADFGACRTGARRSAGALPRLAAARASRRNRRTGNRAAGAAGPGAAQCLARQPGRVPEDRPGSAAGHRRRPARHSPTRRSSATSFLPGSVRWPARRRTSGSADSSSIPIRPPSRSCCNASCSSAARPPPGRLTAGRTVGQLLAAAEGAGETEATPRSRTARRGKSAAGTRGGACQGETPGRSRRARSQPVGNGHGDSRHPR